MNENTKLKNNIMLRVHAIYFMRKLASPVYIKVVLLSVFCIVLLSTVSVSNVVTNLLSSAQNIGNGVNFFLSAFGGTIFLVKFVIIAGIITAVALIRDIIKRVVFSKTQLA